MHKRERIIMTSVTIFVMYQHGLSAPLPLIFVAYLCVCVASYPGLPMFVYMERPGYEAMCMHILSDQVIHHHRLTMMY